MPSQTARCYQNSFALIQSLILGLFLQDRKKKTQSWVHVKMDYKLRDEKTTSPHLWINLDILLHFVLLTVIYFYGLFCQRDKQSLLIYLVTSEDINIDGVKTCQAGSLPHKEFFPCIMEMQKRRNRNADLLMVLYKLFRKRGEKMTFSANCTRGSPWHADINGSSGFVLTRSFRPGQMKWLCHAHSRGICATAARGRALRTLT